MVITGYTYLAYLKKTAWEQQDNHLQGSDDNNKEKDVSSVHNWVNKTSHNFTKGIGNLPQPIYLLKFVIAVSIKIIIASRRKNVFINVYVC